MPISRLQKFILIRCYNSKGFRVNRIGFISFYGNQGSAKAEMRTKSITQSLERLIDRELMTGYGVRTPHKWFIKEVSLTERGRQTARKLLGEQMKLALK